VQTRSQSGHTDDGLVDRLAIQDLLVEYCASLDRGDWAAYGQLFLPDGEFTILGRTRRGPAEIAAGPARDHPRYAAVQHFSSNHSIVIEGDEADACHYVVAVHILDADRPDLHADIGGRYDCRCVRTDDGWRFASVDLTVLWTAGEPLEFAPEPD
jgi:hypothetical protein